MESKHIEALFRERSQREHPCEIGSDRADKLDFAYEIPALSWAYCIMSTTSRRLEHLNASVKNNREVQLEGHVAGFLQRLSDSRTI